MSHHYTPDDYPTRLDTVTLTKARIASRWTEPDYGFAIELTHQALEAYLENGDPEIPKLIIATFNPPELEPEIAAAILAATHRARVPGCIPGAGPIPTPENRIPILEWHPVEVTQ